MDKGLLLRKDGTPRKLKKDGTPKMSGGYHNGGAPKKAAKKKWVGARIEEKKADELVKKYGSIKNAIDTIC